MVTVRVSPVNVGVVPPPASGALPVRLTRPVNGCAGDAAALPVKRFSETVYQRPISVSLRSVVRSSASNSGSFSISVTFDGRCVVGFSATGAPDGVNVAASVCSCAPSRLNEDWLPTYAAVSVVASLKRQRALTTSLRPRNEESTGSQHATSRTYALPGLFCAFATGNGPGGVPPGGVADVVVPIVPMPAVCLPAGSATVVGSAWNAPGVPYDTASTTKPNLPTVDDASACTSDPPKPSLTRSSADVGCAEGSRVRKLTDPPIPFTTSGANAPGPFAISTSCSTYAPTNVVT